jgi:hypothetical protein
MHQFILRDPRCVHYPGIRHVFHSSCQIPVSQSHQLVQFSALDARCDNCQSHQVRTRYQIKQLALPISVFDDHQRQIKRIEKRSAASHKGNADVSSFFHIGNADWIPPTRSQMTQ